MALFEFRQYGEIPAEIDRVFNVNAGLAGEPHFEELTRSLARRALQVRSLNLMTKVMVKAEAHKPILLSDLVLSEVDTVRRQSKELLDRNGAVMTPNYAWRIELLKNRAKNLLHLRHLPGFPEIDASGLDQLAE